MREVKKIIPDYRALPYLRGCNPFQFADRVTKLVGDCLDQIQEFFSVLRTIQDGKDGKDGKDGADGNTPYIKNGYWWIGNTDTNVPARGEKGPKGDTGEQGIPGDKGDKGEQGNVGPKGDTGAKGEKGDKGDKGSKGDKGDTFTYNDFTPEQLAALKGEKGDKGDTGEKGETGPQGEQGPQGEAGVSEVFDISVYNNNAKYADLAAALNGGANIPEALRKGGMSVKFVQSSDHKYVQARCMAQSFTTDVTQWQGVDEAPMAGSQNLVRSGGVYYELYEAKYTPQSFTGTPIEDSYILNTGALGTSSQYHINYYPCKKGDVFKLSYSKWSGTSARSYGVYSTNDPSEFGTATKLAVGPVGNTTEVFNIEIMDDTAQLLAVTVYGTNSNMTLTKQSFVNKIDTEIDALKIADVDAMIASKDWRISDNVTYDSNEIPVGYNITWADGTAGTVAMSSFNDDVFEYSIITATYKDKTIIYTLSYDSNGYITNENINIQ